MTTRKRTPGDAAAQAKADAAVADLKSEVGHDLAVAPVNPVHAPLIAQRTILLAELKATDERLSAIAGTLTAKVKRVTDEIVASAPPATDDQTALLTDSKVLLFATLHSVADVSPVTARMLVDEMTSDLKDLRDNLDQQLKGMINAELKRTSAASDDAATLKSTRQTLAGQIESFNTVLAQMGGDTVEIPAAPRVGSTGMTGSSSAVSKDVEYYRLVKGNKVYYSAGRDLSLIAFHAGVTVGELETILKNAGVESILKPFSQEVTFMATKGKKVGKTLTLTIGADVTAK